METLAKIHYFARMDADALASALQRWKSACPAMGVLALLPEAEKDQVSALQAVCRQAGVPIVGAIFPALIVDGRFVTRGVWLLRLDTMPGYILQADLPTDAEGVQTVCNALAERVAADAQGHDEVTLFMVFDAMVPHIGSLLDELYLRLANRVHYAGVNAGSETFAPMPCLFDSGQIVQHGVLMLVLPAHSGAILEHGYHAPAQTVYATSTDGNRIAQIDWRPAFDVYRELVRQQYGVEVTAQNFYEHAVHFPFGIVRANHHVVVRIPVALHEDGSLFCVGEVPANALLALLQSPAVDTQETLQVLTSGLRTLNANTGGGALLLFYCAGRRMHLGVEAATRELAALGERLHGAPMAGALSLGEIGGSTLHGYPLFHNAALLAAYW
jgi:hypothetical protein